MRSTPVRKDDYACLMMTHENVDVSVPLDDVIVNDTPLLIALMVGIPGVPPIAVLEVKMISPVATAVVDTVTVPATKTAPAPEVKFAPLSSLRVLMKASLKGSSVVPRSHTKPTGRMLVIAVPPILQEFAMAFVPCGPIMIESEAEATAALPIAMD